VLLNGVKPDVVVTQNCCQSKSVGTYQHTRQFWGMREMCLPNIFPGMYPLGNLPLCLTLNILFSFLMIRMTGLLG